MNKEEMIEEIKKMTVVELADLVKAIEEEFGVSAVAAAAPVAAVPCRALGNSLCRTMMSLHRSSRSDR